jgi:xanthine dehydrogenase accessory factor
MSRGMAARVRELSAERVPFVHATVVRAQVPSSAKAGDDAVVLPDGTIEGFVGGTCAEVSVRTAALGALRDGETVLLRVLPDGSAPFPDSPGAQVVVNTCLSGGALEIFLQPMLPAPLIEIVGSTPVADALLRLADVLDYATARSLPGGTPPENAAAVIIASHGRDEHEAIRLALEAGVPYIALVASRRRGAAVLDELDLTPEQRDRVKTPAGLDIGARTAAEVALSILAELVEKLRADRPHATPGPPVPASQPIPVEPAAGVPAPRSAGTRAEPPTAGTPAEPPTAGTRSAPPAAGSRSLLPMLETAIDPVCGMTVTVMPDTPHLTVDGEDIWFCNPGCRDRYAADVLRG